MLLLNFTFLVLRFRRLALVIPQSIACLDYNHFLYWQLVVIDNLVLVNYRLSAIHKYVWLNLWIYVFLDLLKDLYMRILTQFFMALVVFIL